MLFKDGRGYNLGSKLTGFISSLGEKNPLNSAVWCNQDDRKFAWAYCTQTAATVTINNSEGVYQAVRTAEGVTTFTWTSAFDASYAVVVMPLCTSGALGSRLYGTTNGITTTTAVVNIYDSAKAADDQSFFVFAVGPDAGTTNITDNSGATPLTANSLNRVMAVGNYNNPSVVSETCWVLSGARITNTANPGDTLNYNVANCASQTRNAAGSYLTTFTTPYLSPPLAIVTAASATCKYCIVTTTVNGVLVRITAGDNATLVDSNYHMIALGEMVVS